MERLAAAEHLAAQKRSRRLGKLSIEQILTLDAFFKQIAGLDDVARASRSADLVRGNPKIAAALRALNDPAAQRRSHALDGGPSGPQRVGAGVAPGWQG
jgi:hypothetical protein